MKLLIDMNLTPEWVPFFKSRGFEAIHWSQIGAWDAQDTEILDWARGREHVVFTNDLDFGRLLALTVARGPSVLQIRGADLLPESAGEEIVAALQGSREVLIEGALLVVDRGSLRVRILPIRP